MNSSRVQKLKKRDSRSVETRREIEAKFTQQFSEILNEDSGDSDRDIERIASLVPKVVTGEKNEMPTNPIGMQEVEEVVNQMALGKPSGPDGFTWKVLSSLLGPCQGGHVGYCGEIQEHEGCP